MVSIGFSKGFTEFVIAIALFEKFRCKNFILCVKVGNMTRHSSKQNKLRYVNLYDGARGRSPSKNGNLQYHNQNHRVYHKFWKKQNHQK